MKKTEREFEQICSYINQSRNRAIGFLNYAAVSTYWTVGAYVSMRLKNAAWGSKTVVELGDYLKTRHPKLRGFGRRQIYNMVEFYDSYSSVEFRSMSERLKLDEFVQSPTAQIGSGLEVVQSSTAQSGCGELGCDPCPQFLALTTFTNHAEIVNRCRRMDERVFYVLYAAREGLKLMELRRAIAGDAYSSIMSKEKLVTKALGEQYPGAGFLLRDRALLDFLNLPTRHTEPMLHAGIREHMRQFILELGKDFLWMGDEYAIQVGGRRRRLDLLFYHRALRCLVDVELKAVPFEPEFVGKMDFYLSAIDHEIRRPEENPTVGILLCPTANKYDVKYALDRSMSPMMVAEYRRLLIPEDVMKRSLAEYCTCMKAARGAK